MFYSPIYLKKSGRYGVIWLAATQTKILSKRELATVRVSTICSDIINHIPGLKEKGSRATRFSLYLCCQLMYGSVKVLQRQWDFLLVDVQSLCRKCTDAPSSTKDIDLVTSRQAVSIESKIPSGEKDVNFDPYFGNLKEPTIDIDSMLSYLESLTQSRILVIEPLPMPVKPEIGSPHSVSDPKEIQIRDVTEVTPITEQLPAEQDLPRMDIDSFLSLSHDKSVLEIQAQLDGFGSAAEKSDQPLQDELIQEQQIVVDGALEVEDRSVTMMREILMDVLPQTEISVERMPLSPLEETPLAKPMSGMPPPPHKSRLDRPKRPRNEGKKGSRFQEICNDAEMKAKLESNDKERTSSEDSLSLLQQNQNQAELDERGHGHDWAQKNPPVLDLHYVSPLSSPLRKKRPHKLVIDQCLMISRPELRAQMENTSDITTPLKLPATTDTRNIYREPGLKYLKNNPFIDMFTKNCKFGLRMDDTGSEPDIVTSSPRLADFLSRKRARGGEALDLDIETPANKVPRKSTSDVASIEKARHRTSEALSASMERNLSHSLVGQSGDEAQLTRSSISLRGHQSLLSDPEFSKEASVLEQEATLNLGVLATWPEEQELISPVRRPEETSLQVVSKILEEDVGVKMSVPKEPTSIAAEIENIRPEELALTTHTMVTDSNVVDFNDTPRTAFYKLVESNVRTSNDWTTFQNICSPTSCSRKMAASMFNALCAQIARGKLCARQDEPYTSIFIWVPEYEYGSGLSASMES